MAKTEILQGGGETILVVEDHAFLAKVLTETLESNGYKVFTARGGNEALALYLEHGNGIDLVLTDVVMPGMNGVELARALKKLTRT